MAITLYDIAYGVGLALSAPWWAARPAARHKVLTALRERMGHPQSGPPAAPAVWIHAVSNGELGATTSLVRLLADARPDLRFVISTTTATGWERSAELYGNDPRITRLRYPLDFSSAVRRALDNALPSAVILMELEVWPNFINECHKRGIPVILANGRITPGSFRGYRLLRPLIGRTFGQLAFVGAQEQLYADRFISLGAAPGRVRVLGAMKFDSAHVGDRVQGDEALAAALGIDPSGGPVWVCGSTGPGEEELILDAYRGLLPAYPGLRLVIVPRHRPRFDEVANLIAARGFALIRRSQPAPGAVHDPAAIVLGDTMGELRQFYSLASIVFVGRSLVDLGHRQHGSDMIEPAALGKPIIVGHFTNNFAEPVRCFLRADAMRVVADARGLESEMRSLLIAPEPAREMGQRAQAVVRREQGATMRHVEAILGLLGKTSPGTSHLSETRQSL